METIGLVLLIIVFMLLSVVADFLPFIFGAGILYAVVKAFKNLFSQTMSNSQRESPEQGLFSFRVKYIPYYERKGGIYYDLIYIIYDSVTDNCSGTGISRRNRRNSISVSIWRRDRIYLDIGRNNPTHF